MCKVAELRKHIESVEDFRVDLVVVSPMMRTLETACGVFGAIEGTNSNTILMQGQEAKDVRTLNS